MTSRILYSAVLVLAMLATAFGQVATPPVPMNLTASLTPDVSPAVKLAWGVPSGSWGFLVYRSVDDSTHFQKLAMVNALPNIAAASHKTHALPAPELSIIP